MTVERAELAKVPVFQGLTDEQLDWFINSSRYDELEAGVVYWRPGDAADRMLVILEGAVEGRTGSGSSELIFRAQAGDVTGRLPFSRMTQVRITARAVTKVRALNFPVSRFPELFNVLPEIVPRLVGLMSDRIRETTRAEQQHDKLAALGKLSAGLAHELNNPASAAQRSAGQLRDALKRIRNASHDLGSRELTPTQKSRIEQLESAITTTDSPPPDSLTASDLEEKLDSVFRGHGLNDMWQLAADLAQKNVTPDKVQPLFDELDSGTSRAALCRIAASIEIWNLLEQIESSTSRISELVKAIKEYTYMDQAPIQDVNIVKSLENTLTILNHKLKKGVEVKREYQPAPMLVNSYGSELSQVWTNLIDNSIDSMQGKGLLTIRVFRDDDSVVTEIADNGPGILPEVQSRIFEPFFTTKAVGAGTGLGLDTVNRIVRKHQGSISFKSQPGNTCFQVRLPAGASIS